jgi:xanthine dehydrogenase YagS FAD-binding subunit
MITQNGRGGIDIVELIAGGTDLLERRRSGISVGPVAPVARTSDNQNITWDTDGAAIIGSLTSLAKVASDPQLSMAYPGLTAAALGSATPQIRAVGTIGGNLAQRSRCWYYRNPHMPCLKKGSDGCPARGGNHIYGVIFDLGPCVAPHPSTLGTAILAYDGTVSTNQRQRLAIADLFGDGRDGARDNMLEVGEEVIAIHLPPPQPGEQASYRRAISRSHAEWPLVEAVIRVKQNGSILTAAQIAVGGVASVPMRLTAVEEALIGQALTDHTIATAVACAATRANPLPMTGYKIVLMEGLIQDMLVGLRAHAL